MDEEQEYKNNIGLIFIAIKSLHIYWQTEDELQYYKDYGTDGLLKGIRSYDSTKGFKKSTYYYACIENEIKRALHKKVKEKNIKIISLNQNIEEDELQDFISSGLDLERELINKENTEKIIRAINSLKIERDKCVIKYYFGLDGFPKLNMTQIGKIYNCNKNAIMFRKNRALRQLWHKLRGYYYESR